MKDYDFVRLLVGHAIEPTTDSFADQNCWDIARAVLRTIEDSGLKIIDTRTEVSDSSDGLWVSVDVLNAVIAERDRLNQILLDTNYQLGLSPFSSKEDYDRLPAAAGKIANDLKRFLLASQGDSFDRAAHGTLVKLRQIIGVGEGESITDRAQKIVTELEERRKGRHPKLDFEGPRYEARASDSRLGHFSVWDKQIGDWHTAIEVMSRGEAERRAAGYNATRDDLTIPRYEARRRDNIHWGVWDIDNGEFADSIRMTEDQAKRDAAKRNES